MHVHAALSTRNASNGSQNELQEGQNADELMIVCSHVPVDPYAPQSTAGTLYDALRSPVLRPVSLSTLFETLFSYSNLVSVDRGTSAPQRHYSTGPIPNYPGSGRGFWGVETPSLRDYPQQFRRFQMGGDSQW